MTHYLTVAKHLRLVAAVVIEAEKETVSKVVRLPKKFVVVSL